MKKRDKDLEKLYGMIRSIIAGNEIDIEDAAEVMENNGYTIDDEWYIEGIEEEEEE